ncbi:succinate dehydrogenase [Geoglobus acetivorans]|uniref:Succinate dehydrogenase n=1 Tax=Geoglobus acetivorans TaxID=565033 RepID=A0ABZ3H861_GEOAI|nr:succinate dehydrogenase [Geoglobus acetivorans]
MKGVSGWFTLKGKSLNSLAYSFHRLTGIVLLLYLIAHLSFLTSLRIGEETYTAFISTTVRLETLPLDSLLFLATFYHAFNGLRVVLNEFGLLYEARKALIYLMTLLGLLFWLYSTYVMYLFLTGW